MTLRWTRNAAAAALAALVSFALGLTGPASITVAVFIFALLTGLDYTAVPRVKKKDRSKR